MRNPRWKSNYRVPSPIETQSMLCDLIVVVPATRYDEIERQHSPVVNCFAGSKDGGRRGLAQPFHGQGVSVLGRIGVFIDGNQKRAVVNFPEGSEVVARSDIEDIDYPLAPRTKPQRFIDEDGDLHDGNGRDGGVVFKSQARIDSEPVTFSWAPSWAMASGSWAPLWSRDAESRQHHIDLLRRLCGEAYLQITDIKEAA